MRADTPGNASSEPNPAHEPVLEVLAIADDTQVVVTKLPDGKFKATSKSWDEGKVILPDQVIEIRMVGGRLRVARKVKHQDEGDRPAIFAPAPVEGEIEEFLGA